MIKKIAITGPESTGKTTLATELAEYFNTVAVPEYAREYIENLNRPYNYNDILKIARKQHSLEKEYAKRANKLLICDTELIVTKIWCEYRYKKCHQWIIDNVLLQDFDLYILCNIDLAWEYDEIRENPNNRLELFNLYENELRKNSFNYKIVSGNNSERISKSIEFIQNVL